MNNYTPKYIYDTPMFMVTVSVVIIEENGVILGIKEISNENMEYGTNKNISYGFPSGIVKAGQETIQFAAIRHVKEQTGILIKKDTLIPVDFRSEPERSSSGNVIDIGFVVMLEKKTNMTNGKWVEVDFETKKLVLDTLSTENNILLQRALDVAIMIK